MERRFEGRVAVVTGGSRGIGFATARRIVSEGGSVVINGRNEESLEQAAHDLGECADYVVGSVSDRALPDALIDRALSRFGTVDVVINNAGTSAHYGPLLECDLERFKKTMLANTWPAVAIVKAACEASSTLSAVVNVSTIGAHRVHPTSGPYTASKAALEMITQLMARELGPRGIRVNVVAPGLVRTDLARALWDGEREPLESALLPLQRLGEPEDIASAICYLASSDAGWITGTVLPVDGGRLVVGGEPADLIGRYDRAT